MKINCKTYCVHSVLYSRPQSVPRRVVAVRFFFFFSSSEPDTAGRRDPSHDGPAQPLVGRPPLPGTTIGPRPTYALLAGDGGGTRRDPVVPNTENLHRVQTLGLLRKLRTVREHHVSRTLHSRDFSSRDPVRPQDHARTRSCATVLIAPKERGECSKSRATSNLTRRRRRVFVIHFFKLPLNEVYLI